MADLEFPFEREAMKGEPIPLGLTLADNMAFQALSHLYARYRLGKLERDAASAEKKQIKAVWLEHRRLDDCGWKLAKHQASVALATEKYKRDFLDAKSLVEAVKIAHAMIERMDGIPLDLSPEVLEEMASYAEEN